jgi:NAD(P)-dependent dehydrogenase (short-subunit alcohol dehydrogenase family)
VAVVTGAASGIGAALAEALAARGCGLALADVDAAGLSGVAERARRRGVAASEHRLDVADEGAVAAFPAAVLAEHGRVRVLVNNAGVALGGRFEQTDPADFEWLFSINFWGVVRMTRAFLPVLRREPGAAQIVNLSSVFGIVAPPGQAAYAASKFAVRGFSEALRHELEAEGAKVGVTVVLPGGVRTAIAANARRGGMDEAERAAQAELWERLLRLPPRPPPSASRAASSGGRSASWWAATPARSRWSSACSRSATGACSSGSPTGGQSGARPVVSRRAHLAPLLVRQRTDTLCAGRRTSGRLGRARRGGPCAALMGRTGTAPPGRHRRSTPDAGRAGGRASNRALGRGAGLRRPGGGRRAVRRRRGLPPPGALPGAGLRHPRGARGHRRHLGPVPLPRRPLGLRHAHARLRLPAVARGQGHRRRPVHPEVRARHGGEHGVDRRVRFRHRVRRASWSSAERAGRGGERTDTGDAVRLTCGFLLMCSGYYSYAEGHAPEFPGADRFRGRIVHPQFWPEDLDHAGKRVVVVGSGATAVTIVPAMAEAAEHVTMLQRSPTYVVPLPSGDKVADWLRRRLGAELAHGIIRWKNVALGAFLYRLARRRPEQTKRRIVAMAQRALGPGCDAATHFAPRYKPWDQRLCVAPDADLFEAIRSGRASVATDHVEAFTEAGIRLRSGEELRADIVVTATGLKLSLLGGVELDVDGRRVSSSGSERNTPCAGRRTSGRLGRARRGGSCAALMGRTGTAPPGRHRRSTPDAGRAGGRASNRALGRGAGSSTSWWWAPGCPASAPAATSRRAARGWATPSWRPAGTSAAPGTCSATPASARTPTCTRSATPSSRGAGPRPSPTALPSWATCATRRPSTGSTGASASATASGARPGPRPGRAGPWKSSGPTRATPSASPAASC